MPFSKNPLEYKINRLVVKVGMALDIWIVHQPPIHWTEKKPFEKRIAEILGLDTAVMDGLIKKYTFKWRRNGQVKTIWLIPGDKVRRTPGLARFRELFLKR
ncbi:MAG TPA: hypothetical protein VEP90_03615 [Methylomirabilota bacterium]|nr:hypothetical protein [Methylomirabilota bacterium]